MVPAQHERDTTMTATTTVTRPSIATALSDLLAALGFDAMARECATETEHSRLQRYARVILKQSAPEHRQALHSRFVMLRLV